MRLFIGVVLVWVLGACGSEDEPAPSCQQGIQHFYGAGCQLYNSEGEPTPAGTMIGLCQDLKLEAPPQCDGEIDNWLSCMGDVPDPATQDSDCDCSAEFDDLLGCE